MQAKNTSSIVAAVALMLTSVATGCPGETGEDGGVTPTPESSGTVVVDGEAAAYTFDAAESDFIITVGLNQGLLCNSLHEHAVEAENVGLVFALDADDAAGSTMVATVAASGLQPDAPENRDLYLDGAEPLPAGDISAIKGSVLENVNAEEHPTLLFSATNFTDLTAVKRERSTSKSPSMVERNHLDGLHADPRWRQLYLRRQRHSPGGPAWNPQRLRERLR